MKRRLRLLSYLLINVIISALVAWAVISYYDRTHPSTCVTPLASGTTVPSGSGEADPSITNIIGIGMYKDERIVIQNNGSQELTLTGWYLMDNSGLKYIFPQLTLYAGGKVQVHTSTGEDTPTDLYWGNTGPIWTSGELAILYDPQNLAHSIYRVP
jgi:hypothetical protein